MNSQQELLDAINTISQKKDRSFDTPATVLRVEDDTVWVHIDGGADETPVQRTINCSQGDTVQVRISNGSAFLVGNASAPPTDDSVANVAHFVAEQAEETAAKASEEVSILEVEVEGKVDVGDSNIQHLSSTMYQNANGVNIYNDTLAVGDSYAHIDGDSFDLKEVTTAGEIDDANDPVMASFGRTESFLRSQNSSSEVKLTLSATEMKVAKKIIDGLNIDWNGWKINSNKIQTTGYLDTYNITIDKNSPRIYIGPANSDQPYNTTEVKNNSVEVFYKDRESDIQKYVQIQSDRIDINEFDGLTIEESITIGEGDIDVTGDVWGLIKTSGGGVARAYKKTPTVLTSTLISTSETTYTFTDAAIKSYSVIDIYDTIFGFAPTNVVTVDGSCTVTFPAQSSSHQIKLFVY